MKTLIVMIFAIAAQISAAQASCGSRTTTCYDHCESGYVAVAGDGCDTTYDYERGCYKAIGKCSSGESQSCKGRSTSCYDHCTSNYITMDDADSCTTAYDHVKSCYKAIGYCSK